MSTSIPIKYVSAAFLLVSILSIALPSMGQTSDDPTELRLLLNEFLDGAGRNDRLIHDRFWAEDLIYTSSTGRRFGKAELMKGVVEAPAPKAGDPTTRYSAADVDIRVFGDFAVVAFKLVSTTTTADGKASSRNNLNTGTFVKRDDRWQAIAWQSTVIPDPIAKTNGVRLVKPKSSGAKRNYIRETNRMCYYLDSSNKKRFVNRKNCLPD